MGKSEMDFDIPQLDASIVDSDDSDDDESGTDEISTSKISRKLGKKNIKVRNHILDCTNISFRGL
jgi:hypothetical protein